MFIESIVSICLRCPIESVTASRVLLLASWSKTRKISEIWISLASHVTSLHLGRALSLRIVAINIAVVALWSVGVFASLYAGYLHPQFRMTAGQLSSLVNGAATILMFVLIDPQLSVMTDDVVDGKLSEPCFRRAIVWLVGSRCVGTLVA